MMKYIRIFILIVPLIFGSCHERDEWTVDDSSPVPCRMIISKDACGIKDIGNNIVWLNSLIITSFNDDTGNFKGRIWVKNYNGTDYIVTDMPITEGYSGYHVFTCEGIATGISDNSFFSTLSNLNLIWLSYCPQPGTTD